MIPTRTYTDLNLSFAMHPVTHDVAAKYNDEAIKSAVRNLIMFQAYDVPFNSAINSQVSGLLFEPAGPLTNAKLRRAISDVISNYEPRVDLINILVYDQQAANSISITIEFRIKNTLRPITLEFTLYRSR